MSIRSVVRFGLVSACVFASGFAQGVTYYWDGSSIAIDGASGGGSGAWTVGAAGWEDGATAVNWANGNTAVLGGAAGTLTLGGAISAAGVTVQSTGYTLTAGAYTLAAGAFNLGANTLAFTGTVANAFNATTLAGSGTLSLCNGANAMSLSSLNSNGALNFTGALQLRGGTASTAPGTVYSHYLALSGASLTQAPGTPFSLDTGASATNAKDLILGDAFNGQTLSLSSLTGYGAFRVDWGGVNGSTVTRTVSVNQAANTTFNGAIFAHASAVTPNAVRAISFVKDGAGQLTLAGIVGKQTASAGSAPAPVSVEVKGGTLVMTANNTTTGPLTVRTNAVLKMQNASAGTSFSGGNSSMTSNYTVEAGGTLQGFRNGTSAFGTGSILLNGGKLAQEQGNWTWANNIVLGSGLTSTLESQSSNTGTRALKLQGVVSGDGNLTFSDTTGGMGADSGFIFTGSNTLSGTVTIPANRKVRIGGVPGNSSDLSAGIGGTLGTAAIVSDGTLTFSRSDAHTFANAVSGSGNIRVGSAGIAGSGSQILTLSGANTYAGGTGVNTGALFVNGSHVGGSTYAVGTNCTLGGSGTITVAAGATISLQPGATLAPGAAPGAGGTLTLNTLSLSNAVTIAIDAPADAVVVTGDLTLQDNPVTISNASAFNKAALYPILTCQGTVTGTLPSRIAGTHWFIRHDGNTFYLQYNYGTLISVL